MKKYLKDIYHLVKEYDFEKNVHVELCTLTCGSHKKIWWKCKKEHAWQASINNRTLKNSGCPYCSNQKVCQDNCLETTHPDLIKEWSSKNTIKPTEVTYCSRKKVWWKCSKNHEWEQRVDHRTYSNTHCPYCSGHKVCQDNCLSTTHPELAKEWSDKNKIKPNELTHGSGVKIWWKCSKGHEWMSSISERKKYNCPYCSNRKICKDNCLATTHVSLCREWNDSNKIKPTDVTFGSEIKVQWKCDKNHTWFSKISDRTSKKRGCPYCSNQKVCQDNCLSATHPELLKEWNYNKNIIKPEEITYGSKKKIWWKCSKGHQWMSVVYSRSKGQGCPKCNESKGEKLIAQVLDKLQVKYKREYKFKELGKYRFDFALFKKYARKTYAVIEYHGNQHYIPVRFGGISLSRAKKNLDSCHKRDNVKKQYCLNNNIKYIEISYKEEKNNIEKIVKEFIE